MTWTLGTRVKGAHYTHHRDCYILNNLMSFHSDGLIYVDLFSQNVKCFTFVCFMISCLKTWVQNMMTQITCKYGITDMKKQHSKPAPWQAQCVSGMRDD